MKYRGDIQGNRGIGVLLILLGHAGVSLFHGAYVLVDDFFVISGFVITSILIGEHRKRMDSGGGFSLVGFYIRRLQRIFPVATLGIGLTVAAGYLAWNSVLAHTVAKDGLWAFFSLANFREISKATDYFAMSAFHSPLQHYWTLAVEEQFYLLWPLLLLIAFRFGGTKIDWRVRGFSILSLVFVASLSYSIVFTPQNPAVAYFSTFTHLWELAIGGMAAFAAEFDAVKKFFSRPVICSTFYLASWVVIFACAIGFKPGMPYPGAVALIPVLACAIGVMVGIGPGSAVMKFTDNAILRYLGDISFSLYVIHWPFIVFLKYLFAESNPGVITVTGIAGSIILASLIYGYVERPLRGLPIGVSKAERSAYRERRRVINRRTRAQVQRAVAVVGVMGLIGAGAVSALPRNPDSMSATESLQEVDVDHVKTTHFPQVSASASASATAGVSADGSAGALARVIDLTPLAQRSSGGSLGQFNRGPQDADVLPGLVAPDSPGTRAWLVKLVAAGRKVSDRATKAQIRSWESGDYRWDLNGWTCTQVSDGACSIGRINAKYLIRFVGNSHAFMWADGLKALTIENPDIRVQMFAAGSCPLAITNPKSYPPGANFTPSAIAECEALRAAMLSTLPKTRADLTIIDDGTLMFRALRLAPQTLGAEYFELYRAGAEFLARFSDRVVVVESNLGFVDPSTCLNATYSNVAECLIKPQDVLATVASSRAAAAKLGLKFFSLAPLVCTKRACPLFVGDMAVTRDGSHVTRQASVQLIAPLLENAIALG